MTKSAHIVLKLNNALKNPSLIVMKW